MTHMPATPLEDLIQEIAAFARRLAAFVAFVVLLAAVTGALAQDKAPRAADAQECYVLADMALTLRAAAEEGIAEPRALSLVARMYSKDMVKKWAGALIRAAAHDPRPAAVFAAAMGNHCIARQGVMDGVLGLSV